MKYIFYWFLTILHLNGLYSQNSCQLPKGSRGQCIDLEKCDAIYQKLLTAPRPISQALATEIRSYSCGFTSAGKPKVCCAPSITSKISLLPFNICGNIAEDRISHGNKTDINQFPWMAILQYESADGLQQRCGGTLINSRYILTAAHCLNQRDPLNSIVLGEHDTSTARDCNSDNICADPIQVISIESQIVHEDYNRQTRHNDIALIRLAQSADMTKSNVKPICLPTSNIVKPRFNKVKIMGWGTTESGSISSQLLQADLTIVANPECQQIFATQITLTDKHFCAGGHKMVESCQGDSGGPAIYPGVYPNILGPRYVQFGIVSAGRRSCGNHFDPSIYTNVPKYMDWVLENIQP